MEPGTMSLIVAGAIGLSLVLVAFLSWRDDIALKEFRRGFRSGADYANGKLDCLPKEIINHGK